MRREMSISDLVIARDERVRELVETLRKLERASTAVYRPEKGKQWFDLCGALVDARIMLEKAER